MRLIIIAKVTGMIIPRIINTMLYAIVFLSKSIKSFELIKYLKFLNPTDLL